MDWAMHEDRLISCVMWKDKCPVLLLSTYDTPIRALYEVCDTIPRRHGTNRDQVFTSQVLVIRGVQKIHERSRRCRSTMCFIFKPNSKP